MYAAHFFQHQVALVTGAGQGIGFEICRQLARAGASVVLNDLDAQLANQSAQAIRDEGGSCIAYPGDTSDVEFITEMIAATVQTYGSLTIAIANAGITLFGDFFSYSLEAFNRVMAVNLTGSFFLTQAAANQMIKQGSGGSILLTSSVTGHQAHQHLAAYGMSKAALEMLAKNLVIDLSPHQITINTVAPGATLTERTLADEAYRSTWSRITPMGRPASIQDIAHAALFLVAPTSRHITGQSLVVDGGWTSMSPSPF